VIAPALASDGEVLTVESDSGAWFEARSLRDETERTATLSRLVEQLNRRQFAIIRGVVEESDVATRDAQDQAREFMKAPTHAYPWSFRGARVLLRAIEPTRADAFEQLAKTAEKARALFSSISEACLTKAERARIAEGHVGGAAHAVIQSHESWEVHHGLHNDSRRSGQRMPMIATFLLAAGPSAGRLRLWASGWKAPRAIEMKVGDLCLQRDSIELADGKVLYPLTHATEPARSPENAERLVAILRYGILPFATLQALLAANKNPMDAYLDAVTRAEPC
jgi:hypothetical protein